MRRDGFTLPARGSFLTLRHLIIYFNDRYIGVPYMSTKHWFLLQYKPNSHRLALRNLHRQGFETFLPMLAVTQRHSTKFVQQARPLFPGYMFEYKHWPMAFYLLCGDRYQLFLLLMMCCLSFRFKTEPFEEMFAFFSIMYSLRILICINYPKMNEQ